MKNENRKTKLISNGIYGSLSWVLPLILAFFSTPIIVKGLGTENYGIYALVIGFIGYTFNFGIGRAVTKYVSEYLSQNRVEEAVEVVSSTLYISIFLAFIANLLIVLFAETIVKDILQIGTERQNLSINALYISGATIFVLLVSQIYQALIQSAHRFDRLAVIINFNGVMLAVGNIVLILLKFDVIALIWWNLLVSTISGFLFFFSSRKFLPEIKLSLKFNPKSIGLLGKFGLGIFGYQIFGNIILLFERFWIIRQFGEGSLTYYVVPMTLGIYLLGFTISLVQVVFPVISEMLEEREKIIRLYQKSTKIVATLISFAVLSLICGGKLLLALWISPEFAEVSHQILTFHALSFGLIAIYTLSWQLAEGYGKPKINAVISFFWLLITIPAMIFLSKNWGENGIAFARFFAILLTFPAVFYTEKRFLGEVQSSFWVRIFLTLGTAILLSSLVETWIFGMLPVKWFTLLLGGFTGLTIFSICLIVLGFISEDEKLLIKQFIKREK